MNDNIEQRLRVIYDSCKIEQTEAEVVARIKAEATRTAQRCLDTYCDERDRQARANMVGQAPPKR